MQNHTHQALIKYTKLRNRVLFHDGESVANMKFIYGFLLSGKKFSDHKIFPKKMTKEIESYNSIFGGLSIKTEIKEISDDWNIPDEFKNIDVKDFIVELLKKEISDNDFSDGEARLRVKRTLHELKLWKDNELTNLLRTLIHIVNVFREKDIVWGTGRGSSCCCYILYLIGIHDVDSILYDLDLKEFFR